MTFIGFVAALHHRGQRAPGGVAALGRRQRREGQGRGAFEVARHQETARRQGGEGVAFGAGRAQIGREKCGRPPRDRLVLRGVRVEPGRKAAPFGRQRRAGRNRAAFECLARPFGIGFFQQGQVEQPFAGIIDDVDDEGRGAGTQARPPVEIEPQPQFRDLTGRLRPLAVRSGQGGDMILEREARHGVVRLRLQPARYHPAFGGDAENRQGVPAAFGAGMRQIGELLGEGGDENRLAGPRQAGDSEAKSAPARHQLRDIGAAVADFAEKIGQDGQGALRGVRAEPLPNLGRNGRKNRRSAPISSRERAGEAELCRRRWFDQRLALRHTFQSFNEIIMIMK